jgi:hypothetical protein
MYIAYKQIDRRRITQDGLLHSTKRDSCTYNRSGFGGLVVSMLPSGTQDRGFAILAGKIHSVPSFRRGSKAVCPMSQLWGMRKNPALFVNSEIAGQIPIVPFFASRVRCTMKSGLDLYV